MGGGRIMVRMEDFVLDRGSSGRKFKSRPSDQKSRENAMFSRLFFYLPSILFASPFLFLTAVITVVSIIDIFTSCDADAVPVNLFIVTEIVIETPF